MKKVTGLFLSVLLLLVIYINIDMPVYGAEMPAEAYERTGSIRYDLASGTETFVPFDYEDLEQDTQNASIPGFNPQEPSVEDPVGIRPMNIYNNNWDEISPTTGSLSKKVVYLSIATENGNKRGTGFMIGPNTVATCGHNIYDDSYGTNRKWAMSITVAPGMDGNTYPYGVASAVSWEVGANWLYFGDNQDDWGIIRLNTNIGNTVGLMGFHTQTASFNGTNASAFGYPRFVGGVEKFKMYHSYGTITESYTLLLASNNINVSGGMSGGPLLATFPSGDARVIGIIIGDSPNANLFVRIDSWLFWLFDSYRDLTA